VFSIISGLVGSSSPSSRWKKRTAARRPRIVDRVSPLWASALQQRAPFNRPEILRFAADDFMDRFRATLEAGPDDLRAHVVRPETWRTAGDWAETDVPGLSDPVKL